MSVSSFAAARVGPTHAIPSDESSSTIPASRGASGPINAYSTPVFRAYAFMAGMSVSPRSKTPFAREAMPKFRFAITAKISVSLLRARARAIACSRPPPPTTSIFISMYSVLTIKRVYSFKISLTFTSGKRCTPWPMNIPSAPCSRSTTVTTRSACAPAARRVSIP